MSNAESLRIYFFFILFIDLLTTIIYSELKFLKFFSRQRYLFLYSITIID